MPTITELLEERGKIEKTLHALVDIAEAENCDLSAEEDERFARVPKRSASGRDAAK